MRDQIFYILVKAFALVTTIPVHEAAHAWAANRLGDDTAKQAGRLTLNPFAHFDLFGSVCLILFGIGWAKPVPINPTRFRHPRRDMALSSAAGPLSNLAMAFFALIVAKICYYLPEHNVTETLYLLFLNLCVLNIALGIFNMMPFPPFDGSRIYSVFLPQRYYFAVMKYERYILIVILALLWTGVLSGPLNVCNNALFDLLNRATGWVDLLARAAYKTGVAL